MQRRPQRWPARDNRHPTRRRPHQAGFCDADERLLNTGHALRVKTIQLHLRHPIYHPGIYGISKNTQVLLVHLCNPKFMLRTRDTHTTRGPMVFLQNEEQATKQPLENNVMLGNYC